MIVIFALSLLDGLVSLFSTDLLLSGGERDACGGIGGCTSFTG